MITGYKTERLNKPSKIILAIMIIAIMIFFGIVFGCGNYDQMIELRTSGISNYDTSRVIEKDSVVYPYWYTAVLWNQINDTTWERSYFKIHLYEESKADSNSPILIKKDTIINPKFKPKEKL